MKVINITKRQLRKMLPLNLSRSIINKEGKLYIRDYKQKYGHFQDLLKIYNNQSESYIADKVAVITKLIATFESLDMPELVTPTSLVSLDGEISGFAMPFIEDNTNLALLLNNPKVTLSQKIKLLKEILNILIKVQDSHELDGKFFLGDIHEANFIWDITEQTVRAVDMDSSYFSGGFISVSKVTTFNYLLEGFPNKYILDDESGKFIPNKDITSVSFIYMLLNVLSGCNDSHRWSYNEFYNYLSFLEKKGLSKELLDIIANLYTAGNIDIYNPELLDGIDKNKDYTMTLARIHKSNGGYYQNEK
ncbi:MAG TPA: hypothetical protein IAB40_07250 [Candidatus Onthocola stercoravium]|nr:hypothetical protein [Candidatus Onthocola stercoravium]